MLCSIAVVSDISGLGVTGGATSIDALGGLAVCLDSGLESLLGCGDVLGLTLPGLEGRGLKGAAVREGEGPGVGDGRDLVHLVQVQGGLLLRLTA